MSKIEMTKEQLLATLSISDSYRDAAKILGVSPQTISRRVKEFGLIEYEKNIKNSGCKPTIELSKEEILYAQSQTLSAAQAANFLGVSFKVYARCAKKI